MAKTSKTNNKIYLNKYKCLVSQRNFVHSFVCLCMKRESHTHTHTPEHNLVRGHMMCFRLCRRESEKETKLKSL